MTKNVWVMKSPSNVVPAILPNVTAATWPVYTVDLAALRRNVSFVAPDMSMLNIVPSPVTLPITSPVTVAVMLPAYNRSSTLLESPLTWIADVPTRSVVT